MDIIGLSTAVAQTAASDTGLIPLIRAYWGPETMMPLATAVAGAVGVALIFWNRLTGMVRGAFRRVFSRKNEDVFTDSDRNVGPDS